MSKQRTPPVAPELVTFMARLFPDRCPRPIDTDREIWMAVGAAQVVRKLAELSEAQHTTVLPTSDSDSEDGDG